MRTFFRRCCAISIVTGVVAAKNQKNKKLTLRRRTWAGCVRLSCRLIPTLAASEMMATRFCPELNSAASQTLTRSVSWWVAAPPPGAGRRGGGEPARAAAAAAARAARPLEAVSGVRASKTKRVLTPLSGRARTTRALLPVFLFVIFCWKKSVSFSCSFSTSKQKTKKRQQKKKKRKNETHRSSRRPRPCRPEAR